MRARTKDSGSGLSYVGNAAYKILNKKHPSHRGESWNVSRGRVVGDIAQSPPMKYWGQKAMDSDCDHSNFLPERMCEIISRAREWVDITSLSPPDGKFSEQFVKALQNVAQTSIDTRRTIVVRLLFGNIVGMPVDTEALMATMTEQLGECNLQIWVGAWRKDVSWNHSKIIAIDGKYLFTGGHNLWDGHYLQTDPVHDISAEFEGSCAVDGHLFANGMWKEIKGEYNACWLCLKCLPSSCPCAMPVRVEHAKFPDPDSDDDEDDRDAAADYPPMYQPTNTPVTGIPLLTMGRYGAIHQSPASANPSDSAIAEVFRSAKTIIRMSLQDLGPLTLPIPGVNVSIPGGVWPEPYLDALAERIYDAGVDVEIVLSNPHGVPGGLSPMQANYGNGWSCVNVAAEIIKAIQRVVDDRGGEIDEDRLRQMVRDNLRVTFLRQSKEGGGQWPDGEFLGNHAKFFIIDEQSYYIGSQNLYIANLAEWGVLVDDPGETQKIMEQYWKPMWEQSYNEADCDVDEVMDDLLNDHDGEDPEHATPEHKAMSVQAKHMSPGHGGASSCHDEYDHGELTDHHCMDTDTEKAYLKMQEGGFQEFHSDKRY